MAKSSGIVDYIRERFADLEDPAAVCTMLAALCDKSGVAIGRAAQGR